MSNRYNVIRSFDGNDYNITSLVQNLIIFCSECSPLFTSSYAIVNREILHQVPFVMSKETVSARIGLLFLPFIYSFIIAFRATLCNDHNLPSVIATMDAALGDEYNNDNSPKQGKHFFSLEAS